MGIVRLVYCWVFVLSGMFAFGQGILVPPETATGNERDSSKAAGRSQFEALPESATAGNAGLFVGISEFEERSNLTRLRYAADDAVALCHLFVAELQLIPAKNARLAISGEPASPDAQRKLLELRALGIKEVPSDKIPLEDAIETVAYAAADEESLIIYTFSSHGYEEDGTAYIMPRNARSTRLASTGISLETVKSIVHESKAKKRLLIIDACRERPASETRGSGQMSSGLKQALADAQGMAVLASCGIGELSWENSDLGQGVFTHYLIEGLRGGASPDERGYITLGAAMQHTTEQTIAWVRRNRGADQNPWFEGETSAQSIPLAISPQAQSDHLERLRRRNEAIQKLRANIGGQITGSIYDEMSKVLSQDPIDDAMMELIREVEALDGSDRSQRILLDFYTSRRDRFMSGSAVPSPAPGVRARDRQLTRAEAREYATGFEKYLQCLLEMTARLDRLYIEEIDVKDNLGQAVLAFSGGAPPDQFPDCPYPSPIVPLNEEQQNMEWADAFRAASADAWNVYTAVAPEDPSERLALQVASLKALYANTDEYTWLLAGEDLEKLERQSSDSLTGIGVHIAERDGRLVVIAPISGGPAASAGISAGDQFVEIDGKNAIGMKLADAVDMLLGEEDTVVEVRMAAADGGSTSTYRLLRKPIDVAASYAESMGSTYYVRVFRLSEGITEDIDEAITSARAQNADTIILDLRFSPGGLLRSAIEVLSRFVPAGKTVVRTKSRTESRDYNSSEDVSTRWEGEIVVLANRGTAAGAELIIAALQDHDLARVYGPIGDRTFGKGRLQTIQKLDHTLSDGGMLAPRISTHEYLSPLGRQIDVIGLPFDVEVPIPEDHERDLLKYGLPGDPRLETPPTGFKDLVLEAALEDLRK